MTDTANSYPTTITGALPGDIHAEPSPVPAPAEGLEKQILNWRPTGPEHAGNLPLLNYIPREPVPSGEQKS
jgi:hypothetical protein